MDLKPADIIAVHGKALISKLIADATGAISHVGLVTSVTPVLVTQALQPTVTTLPLQQTLDACTYAYGIQPLNMSDSDRNIIVNFVLSKVGEGYDYNDIILQGLNALFRTKWFSNEGASSKHVICSELVAQGYAQVGRNFGVSRRSATPSEIFDFALAHPSSYAIGRLK